MYIWKINFDLCSLTVLDFCDSGFYLFTGYKFSLIIILVFINYFYVRVRGLSLIQPSS